MTDCPLDMECRDASGPNGDCINLPECQNAQAAADHAAEDYNYRKLAPTEEQAVAYVKANTRLLANFVANYTKGLGDNAKRRASTAADHYETAAMWAVKAMVGK